MPAEKIALIAILATLLYSMCGMRAMIHVHAAFGARYLPKTTRGTWAAMLCWPLFWLVTAVRFKRRANRRVIS